MTDEKYFEGPCACGAEIVPLLYPGHVNFCSSMCKGDALRKKQTINKAQIPKGDFRNYHWQQKRQAERNQWVMDKLKEKYPKPDLKAIYGDKDLDENQNIDVPKDHWKYNAH